jgi:hypothetical protein
MRPAFRSACTSRKSEGHCEKISVRCPSATISSSVSMSSVRLAEVVTSRASSKGSSRGSQQACRSRVRASSTWIVGAAEAELVDLVEDLIAVGVLHGLVEPALGGVELAVEHLLGARGQLRGDFIFAAAQHERADATAQGAHGPRRPGTSGPAW